MKNFIRKLYKNQITDLKSIFCLNEILTSPYTNKLNNLFVESKVLEILANEFSLLIQSDKKKKRKNKTYFK